MFVTKVTQGLLVTCVAIVTLAACGEGEETPAGTPTATPPATARPSPLATGTPLASPSPTDQVGPGQPSVLDLTSSPPLLTIFAGDEGDLRNDVPSVAVGDFNGDGLGDLLLGVRFGDGPKNGREDAGEACVIFGSPDLGGTVDLGSGQQDLTIVGAKPGDNLGFSVAAADVNGDGTDDIVVAAPLSEGPPEIRTDRGEVYVIFGSPDLGGTVDLAQTRPDVTIFAAEGFALIGDSIAIADVNGDRIDDLILGAPFAGREPGAPVGGPRTEVGEVYVVFGSPDLRGTVSTGQNEHDLTITGPERYSELGDAMAAGDVNGDGIGDIIAVAEAADPDESRPNAGEVFVVFGSPELGGSVSIAEGQQDLTVLGGDAQDALGFSAASGDINGDGIDDIVMVAQRSDGPGNAKENAGEAIVIFGSPDLGGTIDVASEEQDVTIVAPNAHDLLSSAASADINGDGIEDLLLSTGLAGSPGGGHDLAGSAFVLFGSPELAATIDLAEADSVLAIFGRDPGDRLGAAIHAGDINGDGVPEIILVAESGDGPDNSRPDAGEFYVIDGNEIQP